MNIHEYQAKELLQKFGVATTRGKVASSPEEAEQIAREIAPTEIVVKAQIHAGGRGKGTFANGFKGGVHLCKTPEEAREIAGKMLGQTLVTHQTGAAGRVVNKVLVAQSAQIAREVYFAILLDRASIGLDCSMVEVNPLVVTPTGEVLALDAKFNFDDNALFRHPEVAAMRDIAEEDPREVEASRHGLNYIGLDGNIACLVNGAGLAMAT